MIFTSGILLLSVPILAGASFVNDVVVSTSPRITNSKDARKKKDIVRMLMSHQGIFTNIHMARSHDDKLAVVGASRHLAGENGCFQVKINGEVSILCGSDEGTASICTYTEGSDTCDAAFFDWGGFLDSFDTSSFSNFIDSLDPTCESCIKLEDGYRIANCNGESLNVCSPDESDILFSFDCTGDCCKTEVEFVDEIQEIECCATIAEGSTAIESQCCLTHSNDDGETVEECTGATLDCPDGVPLEECTCSLSYNGETCDACSYCDSPVSPIFEERSVIEFVCDSVVSGWNQTCEDANESFDNTAFSKSGVKLDTTIVQDFYFPGLQGDAVDTTSNTPQGTLVADPSESSSSSASFSIFDTSTCKWAAMCVAAIMSVFA